MAALAGPLTRIARVDEPRSPFSNERLTPRVDFCACDALA